MTRNALRSLLRACLVSAAVLSACSSPHRRIEKNQEAFAGYPPEVQSKIQNGDIDKGFTEQMVYMAKGDPEERSEITRAGKRLKIWKYPLPYSAGGSGPSHSAGLSSPFGYPTFGPNTGREAGAAGGVGVGVHQRAYLIVEFDKGLVSGWSEYGKSTVR